MLQIIRKANSDPDYDGRLYDSVLRLKAATLDTLRATLREAGYRESPLSKSS